MAEFFDINGALVEVPVEVVSEGRDAVQRWYDEKTKVGGAPARPARVFAPPSTPTAPAGTE